MEYGQLVVQITFIPSISNIQAQTIVFQWRANIQLAQVWHFGWGNKIMVLLINIWIFKNGLIINIVLGFNKE